MAPKSVSVTVRYSKPGTQPPVFLAGSFSNPEWQAQEMEHTPMGDYDYVFHKEVYVEEGKEYQYKFRIGEGDWWVLNEDSPSGTDNAGNRNNLLSIPITEEINKKPSDSMADDRRAPSTAQLDNFDAMSIKSIEERMGTREPSDILFDDEIVRDSDENTSVPRRDLSNVYIPHDEEQFLPPIPVKEAAEVTGAKKEFLALIDNSAEGVPAKKNQATHVLEEPQQAILKHNAESEKPTAEDIEGGISADTEPQNLKENHAYSARDVKSTDGNTETKLSPEPALTKEPASTPESNQNKKVKEDVSEPIDTKSTSALTIEQIDAQAGKDGGSTVAEKDCIQVQDTEPGYIIVGNRSPTPELANAAAEVADSAVGLDTREQTPPISDEEAGRLGYRRMSHTPIPEVAETAAEVADSAAELDPGEQTPPISDEEAGQIGYRRMSHTPIPQVAETAAEVADIAAKLDEEASLEDTRLTFEAPLTREYREDSESGSSTPEHEKVPKFPHEIYTPPENIETAKKEVNEVPEMSLLVLGEKDATEPPIEAFPTDKVGIMEALKELQERLPEDETHVDFPPAEEAVIVHRSGSTSEVHPQTPSPKTRVQDSSPSAEEETYGQNEALSKNDLSTLSDIKKSTVGREADTLPAIDTKNLELDAGPTSGSKELDQPQGTDTTKVEGMVAGPVLIHVADTDSKPKKGFRVDLRACSPPQDAENPLLLSGLAPVANAVNTPFVSGSRQLGLGSESAGASPLQESPKFNFIPATPAGSSVHTTDPFESPDSQYFDKGKSTAIEEESNLIKSRKRGPPLVQERPLTPSSIRSAGQEAHERNFLQAFWRVVFVDWIGGFILRLCSGGRRRKALLAVGAVAVLAIAPAFYYLR